MTNGEDESCSERDEMEIESNESEDLNEEFESNDSNDEEWNEEEEREWEFSSGELEEGRLNFIHHALNLKEEGEQFLKERDPCKAYERFKEALLTLHYLGRGEIDGINCVDLKLECLLQCAICCFHKKGLKCKYSAALSHVTNAIDVAQLETSKIMREKKSSSIDSLTEKKEYLLNIENRRKKIEDYVQRAKGIEIQCFFNLKEHSTASKLIRDYKKTYDADDYNTLWEKLFEKMSNPKCGQKRGQDGSLKMEIHEKEENQLLSTNAFGGPFIQKNAVSWIKAMRTNSKMSINCKKVNLGMKFLPGSVSEPPKIIDTYPKRAYSGQYSSDGKYFVSTCQDWKVRIYDATGKHFIKRKQALAEQFNWTLTDACISNDSEMVVYSSITPVVHLIKVDLDDSPEGRQLDCITEKKQILLDFSAGHVDSDDSWGIWSLRFSADKRQIIAGASDNCFYLYEVERQSSEKFSGHKDEVNAVAFADEEVSNVLFTGADDRLIHIWDRRTMRSTGGKPEGTLVGHTEGITYLSSKGDGIYLISNSKDQTMKLWDVRKLMSNQDFRKCSKPKICYRWDYRIDEYPGNTYLDKHPSDQSVVTFTGHKVLRTLIRCHFSPISTTGQRFVYSGSSDGTVRIYELNGKLAKVLDTGDGQVVRDASWHPHNNSLVATSWDGRLYQF